MKWATILKTIKAQGYTGDETPEAIRAWLKSKGYSDIEGKDGKAIDLDAAFAATKAKPLSITEDDEDDAEALEKARKDAQDAAAWRSHKAAEKTAVVHARQEQGASVLTHERRLAKSQYNARVKAFQPGSNSKSAPVYDNADDAELAGAVLRTTMFGGANMGVGFPKSYANAKADEEIIKGNSHDLWVKVQSGITNSVGGALIPVEFAEGIIWLSEQYGFAKRLFRNEPMAGDSKVLRRQTALNTAYWAGEGAAATASDATFDNPTLYAKKLIALSYFTNELVERSAVSVADLVARNFAEAIAYKLDLAAWSGDGTSTYGGITGLINSSGVGLPSGAYINASGGTWSAVTAADHLKLIGGVENIKGTPAFLCSRQFFVQGMLRLAQATGGAVPADFIRGTEMNRLFPTPQDGVIGMFQGYPVYGQQVASTATAATQKCVFFGDFQSACAIGISRELRIDTSAEYAFNTDSMTFRGTFCAGVNIHGDGRGSTVGPIAALVTT